MCVVMLGIKRSEKVEYCSAQAIVGGKLCSLQHYLVLLREEGSRN
jgi:hypothetical protein